MKRWLVIIAAVMILASLLGCGQAVTEIPLNVVPTPNPVDTSTPIYGGVIEGGLDFSRNFDSHQMVAHGPAVTLPVFNQLVMFDINYRETGPQTIIGDLAEIWDTSPDSTEITFHLHQGVNWHDGIPFTADDVIYSLDKMTDPNRSVIAGWFPAYEWTERIDDYTVKVHLKYPSVGFMLALAQGESQIQPKHLAGVKTDSAAFMVGTGPFTLEEYKPGVVLKYKRNQNYFKTDKYGNQLPYLDGIIFNKMSDDTADNALVTRRLDLTNPAGGTRDVNHITYWQRASPELLWQQRETNNSVVLFLNINHPPLDDIRVRRALGLVLDQEKLIIGYGADPTWFKLGGGLLDPSIGLPTETVAGLMGWGDNVTYQDRVAEAKKLMAEAGYQDGFKLNMLTSGSSANTASGTTGKEAGVTVVLMDILRRQLNIDVAVSLGLNPIEFQKRLDEGSYDTYTVSLDIHDPAQLANYFATSGNSNYSNYSNPELDKMLDELDQIDPAGRQAAIWEIERTLLIDKPALPMGLFVPTMVPYYPQVKNFRVNNLVYSNLCRLEDVWIDESLRVE